MRKSQVIEINLRQFWNIDVVVEYQEDPGRLVIKKSSGQEMIDIFEADILYENDWDDSVDATTVNIQVLNSPFIHAAGTLRYAQTAYKSGDREIAIKLMAGLFNERITEEGIHAILQGLVPLHFDRADAVSFSIPNYWIQSKEATDED